MSKTCLRSDSSVGVMLPINEVKQVSKCWFCTPTFLFTRLLHRVKCRSVFTLYLFCSLQNEVSNLESCMPTKTLSPYLIPNSAALIEHLPLIQRLAASKKFVIVIPGETEWPTHIYPPSPLASIEYAPRLYPSVYLNNNNTTKQKTKRNHNTITQ